MRIRQLDVNYDIMLEMLRHWANFHGYELPEDAKIVKVWTPFVTRSETVAITVESESFDEWNYLEVGAVPGLFGAEE